MVSGDITKGNDFKIIMFETFTQNRSFLKVMIMLLSSESIMIVFCT